MAVNEQLFNAVFDAMVATFADEAALAKFTRLRLGKPLAQLAPPGFLEDRIFNLLERAESRSAEEVMQIAQALFQAFPDRENVAGLASFFPAAPAQAPAAGAAPMPRPTRLYGSQYVIDREDVWETLRRMSGVPGTSGAAAEQPGNVLLVTGRPKVGKSLVADLVAHLARQSKHQHAEVKFRHIRLQPDAAMLANLWLARLHPTLPAADRVPLQTDPTNFARQPLDAATAVIRALAAANEPWWLVFDGPDSVLDEQGRPHRPPLPRTLLDFFDILCDAIAASYRHVRLVLIGVDGSDLSSRRAGVQEVDDVTLPHLVALFEQICKDRTPPAEAGVPELIAKHVWSRVPQGCVGHVEKLHKEIAAALQLLSAPGGSP